MIWTPAFIVIEPAWSWCRQSFYIVSMVNQRVLDGEIVDHQGRELAMFTSQGAAEAYANELAAVHHIKVRTYT